MKVMIKGRALETVYTVIARNTLIADGHLFSVFVCQIPVGNDAGMASNDHRNTAVWILYMRILFFECFAQIFQSIGAVSYTHLRAHET